VRDREKGKDRGERDQPNSKKVAFKGFNIAVMASIKGKHGPEKERENPESTRGRTIAQQQNRYH